MKRLFLVLSIVTAGLLSACATVTPEAMHANQGRFEEQPLPGKATIVVIRRTMLKGAIGPWDVKLDGREIAKLPVSSYVVASVAPGDHWLSAWVPTLVKIEAGKTCFFDIDLPVFGGSNFTPIPDAEGAELTAGYARVRPQF